MGNRVHSTGSKGVRKRLGDSRETGRKHKSLSTFTARKRSGGPTGPRFLYVSKQKAEFTVARRRVQPRSSAGTGKKKKSSAGARLALALPQDSFDWSFGGKGEAEPSPIRTPIKDSARQNSGDEWGRGFQRRLRALRARLTTRGETRKWGNRRNPGIRRTSVAKKGGGLRSGKTTHDEKEGVEQPRRSFSRLGGAF